LITIDVFLTGYNQPFHINQREVLMKAIIRSMLLVVAVLTAFPLFAIEKELNGKIGTSYSHDLSAFGLDMDASYLFKLDPYFVAGFEGGLYWIPWEKKVATLTGPPARDVKEDTNIYSIPFFLIAQVRLPFLVPKIYVEPSLTFGLGYNFLVLTYEKPEISGGTTITGHSSEIDFYHGFAWQLYTSVSYMPPQVSRIKFSFDFGYRGSSPERTDEQVNISGILMRLGVIFTFQ